MTNRTAFRLDRRVFESERTLFVNVTLDTGRIRAGRQSGLLQLKTTMRIVTVAAAHCAFQNLVMERHAELRLNFAVTAGAKLRIVRLQHPNR